MKCPYCLKLFLFPLPKTLQCFLSTWKLRFWDDIASILLPTKRSGPLYVLILFQILLTALQLKTLKNVRGALPTVYPESFLLLLTFCPTHREHGEHNFLLRFAGAFYVPENCLHIPQIFFIQLTTTPSACKVT